MTKVVVVVRQVAVEHQEVAGLVLHRYQAYLSGLIFLVDPFTFPDVREAYAEKLAGAEGAVNPSRMPVEDALSRTSTRNSSDRLPK